MDAWIDELATELGEEPLTTEEVVRVLGVARDVAHRVERKTTPLATFLIGAAVGRAEAGGMDRPRALEDVFASLEHLLPEAPPGAEPSPSASSQEAAEARGEGVSPDDVAPSDASPSASAPPDEPPRG